jgi:hypothetical protein
MFVSGVDLDARAKVARDLRWGLAPEFKQVARVIHQCEEKGRARRRLSTRKEKIRRGD